MITSYANPWRMGGYVPGPPAPCAAFGGYGGGGLGGLTLVPGIIASLLERFYPTNEADEQRRIDELVAAGVTKVDATGSPIAMISAVDSAAAEAAFTRTVTVSLGVGIVLGVALFAGYQHSSKK